MRLTGRRDRNLLHRRHELDHATRVGMVKTQPTQAMDAMQSIFVTLAQVAATLAALIFASTVAYTVSRLSDYKSNRISWLGFSNEPPAKPGAFWCEPLKAAVRGR